MKNNDKNFKIKSKWAIAKFNRDNTVMLEYKESGKAVKQKFENIDQINSLIKTKQIAIKEWIVAVDSSFYIKKKNTLPATNFAEAVKMLEFEIDSIFPVEKERFAYSALPGKTVSNGIEIFVCITLKKDLQTLLDVFKKYNLNVKRIIVDLTEIKGSLKTLIKQPCNIGDFLENGDFKKFNLLPQEYINKSNKKALVKNIAFTAAAFTVFVISTRLAVYAPKHHHQKQIAYYTKQIEPVKHIAGKIEAQKKQIQALEKQINRRGFITTAMKELYQFTPENISINELVITCENKNFKINIRGQSETLTDAFGYTESVKQSSLLRTLNIENIQQIPLPSGNSIVEFNAECIVKDIVK